MAWALWLAVPVVLTVLAALWVWWRGRPPRTPDTHEAMQAHRDYLDALALPLPGVRRGPAVDAPSEADPTGSQPSGT